MRRPDIENIKKDAFARLMQEEGNSDHLRMVRNLGWWRATLHRRLELCEYILSLETQIKEDGILNYWKEEV